MKRGQLKLSLGMIFSIILIIIFISVAFYAIQKFLEFQNTVNIGKFKNDLQNDVDNLWRGVQGQQDKEYFLPKKIKKVCFADYNSSATGQDAGIYEDFRNLFYEKENLFFYPVGSGHGLDAAEIKHMNLKEITSGENPYCIDNVNGKVKVQIKKDFGEALVSVKRT